MFAKRIIKNERKKKFLVPVAHTKFLRPIRPIFNRNYNISNNLKLGKFWAENGNLVY